MLWFLTTKANAERLRAVLSYRQQGNRKSSGENEKHGDGDRAKSKAEKQIENIENQSENATSRKEKDKINRKIQNIRRDAEQKAKGEEHSNSNKR